MPEINFQTLSSFLWSFWTILGLFSVVLVPFLDQELPKDKNVWRERKNERTRERENERTRENEREREKWPLRESDIVTEQ